MAKLVYDNGGLVLVEIDGVEKMQILKGDFVPEFDLLHVIISNTKNENKEKILYAELLNKDSVPVGDRLACITYLANYIPFRRASESGAGLTAQQQATLDHIIYNFSTDQLEADRAIVTILNTFSLSNIHDMTSIGENIVFKNNASKITWSPLWLGVKEQHIPAYQGKLGVIQASGRDYSNSYVIQQGSSAASSGSIPYESTSVLGVSSAAWALKPTVAEAVLDTDYLFYEVYYGSDDTGLKAYEQVLNGVAFSIGDPLYSLDPADNVTPLDMWYFKQQAEFHIGSELYFRITKSNSRDSARTILNVRPDSVTSSNYFVEVRLRDFTDLDVEYISPFLNYEGMNFSTDDTNTNIIFSDHVTDEALKPFFINELKAIDNGIGGIQVYIKDGAKVYIKELDIDKTYIDGILVTQTLTTAVNELNSLFSNTGTSTDALPIITSSLVLNLVAGESLNHLFEATYGSEVIWDFSSVLSVTTKEGNNWNVVGGDLLTEATYNVPVIARNSNGSTTGILVIIVSAPAYANTKAIRFNNNDYLQATATTSNPFYRAANGTGVSDAWTSVVWFKGGTNGSSKQTIYSFGGNDEDNEGRVWLKWDASGGNKRIVLRYGTKNNHLSWKTPVNSFLKEIWGQVIVTYTGNPTGQDQNDLNDYFGTVKIAIDGVNQVLTTEHSNDGWSGSIKAEVFKLGESAFGGDHLRNNCIMDELYTFHSDQSSNITDIYNGGTTHDASLLTTPPSHYWRMGDGDTYPIVQDNIGSLHFTQNNQSSADTVNDVP